MKILNLKTYFGVEHIVKNDNVLKYIINNNDDIDLVNISICEKVFKNARATYSDEFFDKYYDIMNFVFNDERIKTTKDQSYVLADANQIAKLYGYEIKYSINKNLIDQSISQSIFLPDEFITISTKVWNLPEIHMNYGIYEKNKHRLINILKKYKGKVILLGEKVIKSCNEYDLFNTFSIYNDMILLPNCIDFTINDSGNNNDLYELKRTFLLMSKSRLNIMLTTSGIRTTSLYLSENILGFTYEDENHCYYIKKSSLNHNNISNINFVNNIDDFIEKLEVFVDEQG